MLRQPSRGASSSGLRQHQPISGDHRDIEIERGERIAFFGAAAVAGVAHWQAGFLGRRCTGEGCSLWPRPAWRGGWQ